MQRYIQDDHHSKRELERMVQDRDAYIDHLKSKVKSLEMLNQNLMKELSRILKSNKSALEK